MERHIRLSWRDGAATVSGSQRAPGGHVDGSDDDYDITINTNSSVLMQHIQWVLALANTTKAFFVAGSSTNGDYPYAVVSFSFWPLTSEPGLVAAEVALPEIAAGTPDDLPQGPRTAARALKPLTSNISWRIWPGGANVYFWDPARRSRLAN